MLNWLASFNEEHTGYSGDHSHVATAAASDADDGHLMMMVFQSQQEEVQRYVPQPTTHLWHKKHSVIPQAEH